MPVSPKLTRQLDRALGKEAAEELVNWVHEVDARRDEIRNTLRADLAELRQEIQAGFRRSDAKVAELRQEMQAGFARSDAKLAELRQDMQTGFARSDAKLAELRQDMQAGDATLRQEMAHLEARLERRIGDLIKWSFVFWVGAVGAVAMLAGVLG
jgi:hypothetical protein